MRIQSFLKKYQNEILGVFLLSILYFGFRLFNLLKVPIFTDESIYLWWAQTGLHDASWRFISLVDGKQPLFVWFVMGFLKLFKDPLLTGRVVSVISGFFTLIGLLLLSNELFRNKKITFLTGLLYIAYPFAHVYDRMALMDGMVGTFAIWGIYFSVLLVRRVRLDISYTLGFILGGGMLTKSSGALVAYMLPLTLLLFPFKTQKLKNFIKWACLALFAFILAEVLYNSLRLSPYFYIIKLKNAQFVYPFSEWIHHPLSYFINNLLNLSTWLLSYFNVYFLLLIPAFLNFKAFLKEKILLVLYFILPFLALSLFGKEIFPRYVYSMTLSLLPVCAFGLLALIEWVNKLFGFKKNLALVSAGIIFLLVVAYPFWVSFNFSTNPIKANIASADLDQYVVKWPAGTGINESKAFLENKAQNGPIFVGTQGTFGLLPYAYDIYFFGNPNIQVRGYYPVGDTPPDEVQQQMQKVPTYFVFYQPCPDCKLTGQAPDSWSKYQEVFSYAKPDNAYIKIYKLN